MTPSNDDPQARLRRNVYLLLILLGTGAMLGRILAVDSVDKTAIQQYRNKNGENLWLRRPFLSANDRSRWCTVRALVEEDMRVKGHPYAIDKVIQQQNWDTIDMVKHDGEGHGNLGPDEGHLYSSKPPLFSTLIAGEYWVIRRLTGMSLDADHAHVVGRFMLITINVIPLLIYFLLLARLIERFGTTDWGRMFVMGAAVFGTFLTTFAVVVNNHLPAAVCATVALYAAVRIWFDGERRWWYFVIVGLFGGLMAANEQPALALLGLLSVVLLCKAPSRTILLYLPAVAVVAAGFFGTNWIAHKSSIIPYMHRSKTDPSDNWYDYTYIRNGREESSYWKNPVGVDRGEESPCIYAMHVLVGHHGIFSLTPVWLLSAAGMLLWLCHGEDRRLRELAIIIAAVTLACLIFYLTRPAHYRNYGGLSSGLRWMFWCAPLWLLTMLPAADELASRRWTRLIAGVLLVVSVISVTYPTWNPWTNPWLWDFYHYMRWLG